MAATDMIDKLRDRLPAHASTQRLALLRFALGEVRLRCALHAPPVDFDADGKPKQPSPSEQASSRWATCCSTRWRRSSTGDAPSPPLMRSFA
jgi:hypothetical protein